MRVVIPSVNYADMLAVTLPAWKAILPASADLRVVTSAADEATQVVARAAGVEVVVTDAWSRDGAQFNKAAGLDVGFGFAGSGDTPRVGEVCLALDADVYPGGPLPVAQAAQVVRDTLYGCSRHLCADPAMLALVVAGKKAVTDLPRRNAGTRVAGYFQLFKYRAGLTFGSFPTAGYYDLEFHKLFSRLVDLSDYAVLHLGATNSRNWTGHRATPQWSRARG